MKTAPQVLVAGAGPTGLALALWLTRLGVSVTIIDKARGPGETSRAMAVQARTLELYQQIPGLAPAVINDGIEVKTFNLFSRGRVRASVPVGLFGQGLTPYPYILTYPQDWHEKLLVGQLTKAGVEVQWQTEIIEATQDDESASVTLRLASGETSQQSYAYICGCDGAHSFVRKKMALEFPGGTYEALFYVADVDAKGSSLNGNIPSFCLENRDITLVFPLKHDTATRLIGIVPTVVAQRSRDVNCDISFEDIRGHVKTQAGLDVTRVNWFSTYHTHHRVAQRFRLQRFFLLGDAAHIHSPAGGQGMNTGIGDAINLAWKLAMVLQGRAGERLLDSYENERRAFALTLVQTTDRVFKAAAAHGLAGYLLRRFIFPGFLRIVPHVPLLRREVFRRLSQLAIHYRTSDISRGAAGTLQGGDRLPWVAPLNNFAVLDGLGWQMQVYGVPAPAVREFCARHNIALHIFEWDAACADQGFLRNAAYLVRPDGHIGLIAPSDISGIAPSDASGIAPPDTSDDVFTAYWLDCGFTATSAL